MAERIYKFHTDPGHGWLQVERGELERLEIADQISAYSYESKNGLTVFLEEDCDASAFKRAKDLMCEEFDTETRHVDYDHPLRNMRDYTVRRCVS